MWRKGCTLSTALTSMLDMCLWACAGGGDWRVTVYFRCQLAVKPDGWAYINGGLSSPRCMVKPMAVREGDVQVRRHTRCSSVMQSHRTGRSHTSDRVSQTFCISCAGDGPRAPTRMLSLNCAKDTVFPRGVVHSGCPLGEKESWPIRLIKSVRCLAAQMDLRSALWALNGPPMGIAPVRDHTLPEACVYVSVSSEKYTRFSRSWWRRWVNLLVVPIPARSRDLLSRWMLHISSFAFHRRFLDNHLTDAVRSDITDWGVTLLN